MLVFFLPSCKKEAHIETASPVPPPEPKERWYGFVKHAGRTTLERVSSPHQIPHQGYEPWSLAVRVAGIALSPDLLIVNRAGVVEVKSLLYNSRSAIAHSSIFDVPVQGVYNTEEGVFLCTAWNTVFQNNARSQNPSDPFLYKYHENTKTFIPVASTADVHLSHQAQCTAIQQDTSGWLASFKTDDADRVSFTYLSFASFDKMAHTSTQISAGRFRQKTEPRPLAEAGRSVDALVYAAQEAHLLVHVVSPDGQKVFQKGVHLSTDESFTQATVVLFNKESPVHAVLLTEQGRLFIQRHDGTVIERHLPELPPAFVYTFCTVVDNMLVLSFEEQDFYKVGRAGVVVMGVSP